MSTPRERPAVVGNAPEEVKVEIKKVLVVGTGTLGSQIGFQCALHGFETTMYDIDEGALEACRKAHVRIGEAVKADLGTSEEDVAATHRRLSYTTDLPAAAAEADLVSESVPENPELKRKVHAELGKLCPARTILTTNSSTLLPSEIAGASGRPERFLALHFANQIWVNNVAEIMRHPGTAPEVFEEVVRFARSIGMVPIRLEKEQNGYVLNTLLVPLLSAALTLVANGIATPQDVDRTWMIAMKVPMGPFGTLDMVGLKTAHDITAYWAAKTGDPQSLRNAAYLKENYVDRGRLGVATGEGFYTYPDPEFRRPDFLT